MTVKRMLPNRIVLVAMMAFSIYVLVSLFMVNQDITTRQQEIDTLTVKISEQSEENLDLRQIVEQGVVDDVYVEKVAREQLNFVYPDEIVFQDMVGSS